jgi:hypothetical protein
MDRPLVVGDEDNSATEVSDGVENLCSTSRIEVIRRVLVLPDGTEDMWSADYAELISLA